MAAVPVDVWEFDLDAPPLSDAAIRDCLNAEEEKKAAAFIRPQLSRRFAAGRAVLKTLLSRQLGCAPRELTFRYNAYGKPLVQGCFFNLAHSGHRAVAALCETGEVGIDIEREDPDGKDLKGIVRYFSAAEQEALKALSFREFIPAFFRLWVRKEAVMKADGQGLSLGTEAVEAQPEEEKELVTVAGSAWQVPVFLRAPCWVAVALRQGRAQVRWHRFD